MKHFALGLLTFTAAACLGAGVDWVRAGVSTNHSVWGIRGGLLWAIAPAGFRDGEPGGLLRLGYPVLSGAQYDLWQMAPPFDFLAKCFVPLLHRMGTPVELELVRPGFYPAGGGQFHARIKPGAKMARLDLMERGPIRQRQARILISRLPEHVAEKELAVLRSELKWQDDEYTVETISHPRGPGNAVVLTMEAEHVAEVVAAIGERGRRAEDVAMSAIEAARVWLDAGVPVDEHLADQLLIPMALARGGAFRTTRPSLHTTTNAEVIRYFLPIKMTIEQESEIVWRIDLSEE